MGGVCVNFFFFPTFLSYDFLVLVASIWVQGVEREARPGWLWSLRIEGQRSRENEKRKKRADMRWKGHLRM